jgi:septum formation protein
MTIILASGSKIRLRLLQNAGVTCAACKADIDERVLKVQHQDTSPEHLAAILADAKAQALSMQHPTALVIGADQILFCGGRHYDKPDTLLSARAQLLSLRGRTHHLFSAVSCWQGRRRIWGTTEQASLRMRAFSDAFLDGYLRQMGNDVTTTVGGYMLEGQGAQLFERIEGDYFGILGLPLLPVLEVLRQSGELAE